MKLEVRLRSVMRVRHYSLRTEDSYFLWYKRFVRFHGRRHPRELGRPEVEQCSEMGLPPERDNLHNLDS